MSSASNSDASPKRLKAEGFPVSPLIEAVMEVQFEGDLTPDDTAAAANALGGLYSTKSESQQTEMMYDIATSQLNLNEGRTVYRLEATDDTEVALVRQNGLVVSQLAPYKSWSLLFSRFARDWEAIEATIGARPASRLAVRYINRIDVPMDEHGRAEHEQYLAGFIQLPAPFSVVSDFYFRVGVPIPEIEAIATIQSAVMAPAVEGKASFALDIDIAKTQNLAADRVGLLSQLELVREHKNAFYRALLTGKALEELS